MQYSSHHIGWLCRVILAGGWNVSYKYGKGGFNSHTRYVLIIVSFLDKHGLPQVAKYTTNSEKQKNDIVKREKKKKSVIAIQVGSVYVYRKK